MLMLLRTIELMPNMRSETVSRSMQRFMVKLEVQATHCVIWQLRKLLFSTVYFSCSSTVAIKSIRRSQVTGLLDLTKGHSGHRSQTELTNSFFGPLKWLPKATKVQKSPPARLARFRQGELFINVHI